MPELPLDRHVVVCSTDSDDVSGQFARELPAHRLEGNTEDLRLNARLHAVRLPHIVALYLAYGCEVRSSYDHTATSVWIQMPVSGSLRMQVSDTEFVCTTGQASVTSASGRVAMTWSHDCATLAFRIERRALEDELESLIDGPVEQPLRFEPVMDLASERVRSWFAIATSFTEELNAGSGLLEHPRVVTHAERLLLRGLLLSQPHSYSALLRDELPESTPWHVRAAVRLLEDRPEHSYTAVSLARDVGVGARALQDGFRQYVHASPMQFLRGARLNRVRADLLATTPATTTVADIAHRWGFAHLGRFAQYYRARYGESPSDTLRASG
ncbi:AraC family transcriptional regulator [Dactylosporangium fulvum]|uniref:AraC family transcriptional regulator n=1 Tax=Dactylosporangium fulvum TaxID=53359 RepID=A0ABY5W5B9_9ACTN|nr:AraC family transcriptional regulator [Dactylosporangium fulvum]UWP85238.1 AraC family transcriptional regulator [Dactylosporangium fulvum]